MNAYELLDKESHKSLKVRAGRGAALGDSVMHAMTYPMEFRDVQANYPILFTRDPANGAYFATAIFGFEDNENLFLDGDKWLASYVPAMVRRQPFMIARQTLEGGEERSAVSIDMSHPRVSEDQGEALFTEAGEPSEFLNSSIDLLHQISQGVDHNRGFIDALIAHELLEAVTLDFTFNDGTKTSLQGFFTVAEETLYRLEGETLAALNQAGYLQPIFMAVASLGQLRALIEKRNARALAGRGI